MKKYLTALALSAFFLPAYTQSFITGMITDAQGEELPFVHIIVNDQKDRVFTSEVNGAFSIPASPTVSSLTFTYVGYAVQRIELESIPNKPLRIVLQPEAYLLQEAVVVAGENPAHRIIREAVKNRNRNNPEKLNAHQYRAFTKVTMKLLPDRDRLRAMRERFADRGTEINTETSAPRLLSDSVHLFLMETLSEHAFQKPLKTRQEVLRHRTSGFEEPWFVGIALQLQPFSFYRDELPFLEKRYLNPVSPGSTGRYHFRLDDTFTSGPDSVFVIAFRPRPGTAFTGLKGVLYIHSAGYAIQHLIAESAEEEFIQFHIDQKYSRAAGGQWFPEQLHLVLEAEKYPNPAIGMRLNSRTYIDSVQINPAFPKGFFEQRDVYITSPEVNRKDSLLALSRKEPVTYRDSITYVIWDSLGQARNLDGKIRLFETVAEGAMPLGKIDWVFADLIRTSDFEGFTPGLGLRTSNSLSKHFRLYGYTGYAFRAKQWKHAASLSIFPQPDNRQFSIDFSYKNDLTEPAIFEFPLQSSLVNRRFFAQRMDRQRSLGASVSVPVMRYLYASAGLRQQIHTPLFNYQYLPQEGPARSDFQFAEADLYLRFAYGVKVFRLFGSDVELQSNFPILHLRIAKGWNGFWGGQYDYWRAQGLVQHTLRHRRWGATNIVAEAGWCAPEAPYAKLFTPVGTGGGFNLVGLPTAFETMGQYEFVSDKTAHIYVEHTFNRISKKSKVFQPQPAIIHRMGWGNLAFPERHGLEGLRAMNEGYFESGIALHSLIRFNYLNIAYVGLGLKAVYRYGPYRLSRFEDNVAVRLTFNFNR